ncbi:MAG: DUF3341 domain-containing protein [Chitinophagia bacterium]|nr:DUF3341 domain-containing protein [Chitinophagia bacterium]
MAIKKFAVAAYDDEEVLFKAVSKVRKSGFKLHDVYTPFPVHGLDVALGLKETDLHIAGFIYALCGTSTAVGFISWIYTADWSINYGGKPHFALPAWIPVTFELTVLFAAVGMVLTFCYLNQIMPGVKKHVFHPRQSDDLFVLVLDINNSAAEAEAVQFLKSTHAIETSVQMAEEGWWYGSWDKKEQYELLNA